MATTTSTNPADNASDGFKLVRRGTARVASDVRPSEKMLANVPDGTLVEGPDGVQWIAMPAQPRRWERAKRSVTKAEAAAQNKAETAAETSAQN